MCSQGFPGGSVVKNLPANVGRAGDAGSNHWVRKIPAGGNGNSLQSSCLGNHMGKRAWWTTVHWASTSQPGLSTQAHNVKKAPSRMQGPLKAYLCNGTFGKRDRGFP